MFFRQLQTNQWGGACGGCLLHHDCRRVDGSVGVRACRGGLVCVQAADAVWRDARAAGVQPDLYLYSAMIDACAKVGAVWVCGHAGVHAGGICDGLARLQCWPRWQHGILLRCTVTLRPPLLLRLLQCRDAGAALRVFEEMQQRGEVQPDVVTYTSLLTALQGAPQVRWRAGRHLQQPCCVPAWLQWRSVRDRFLPFRKQTAAAGWTSLCRRQPPRASCGGAWRRRGWRPTAWR